MKLRKILFGVVLLAIMAFPVYSQEQYDDEDDFLVVIYDKVEMFNLHGKFARIILYTGSKNEINIPPTIKGAPVTEIWNSAFSFMELTSVTIPDTVTYIGKSAFEVNQLTSITLPEKLTSIGDSAFAYNQLSELIIPDNVTHVGGYAFANNPLTSVVNSNTVNSIGDFAFTGCYQLVNITIPGNVDIGAFTFENDFFTFYARRGRRAGAYRFIRDAWELRSIYQ